MADFRNRRLRYTAPIRRFMRMIDTHWPPPKEPANENERFQLEVCGKFLSWEISMVGSGPVPTTRTRPGFSNANSIVDISGFRTHGCWSPIKLMSNVRVGARQAPHITPISSVSGQEPRNAAAHLTELRRACRRPAMNPILRIRLKNRKRKPARACHCAHMRERPILNPLGIQSKQPGRSGEGAFAWMICFAT
jgi:hypothetical protein